MKKIYCILACAALAMAASCTKNELPVVEKGSKLSVSVLDSESKAVFDAAESKTLWSASDKIGVMHEYAYDNSGKVTYAKNNLQQSFSILSSEGASAKFQSDGNFNWVTPADGHEVLKYRFMMYYPYNENSTARDNVVGTLPSSQNYDMTGTWDISSYDFLYSPAVEVVSQEEEIVFPQIYHLFSILRLEFVNDSGSDLTIAKVKVESEKEKPIAGTFKAVISKGRPNECLNSATAPVVSSGYFTAPESSVETTVANGLVKAGESGSVRLMINAAPTTILDNSVEPFLGYNSEITYAVDATTYESDVFKVTLTLSDDSVKAVRFFAKDIERGGMAVKQIPLSRMAAAQASCNKPEVEYYAERTKTSASFNITLPSDATAVKYLVQNLATAAPTADYVYENGIEAGEGKLTVSELTEASAYRLYVVATAPSAHSDLVSAIFRTIGCQADYYEEGITIGSQTYDKNTAGVKTYDGSTFSKGGVYFVDSGDYSLSTTTTVEASLVLIGRYDNDPAHSRPTFSQTVADKDIVNLKSATSLVVLENCDFVVTRYLLNQSNTPTCNNNIIVDNCGVKSHPSIYKASPVVLCGGKGGFATENVIISNCVVNQYNTTKLSSDKPLLGFYASSGIEKAFPKMKSIRIYNNTFYYSLESSKLSSAILQMPLYKAEDLEVEIFNNTVYNLLPSTANSYCGYVCVGNSTADASTVGIKSLTLKDNIFYHGTTGGESAGYSVVQNGNLASNFVNSGNILYNAKNSSAAMYSDKDDYTILDPGFSERSGISSFKTTAEGAASKGDPRWRKE